MCQIDPVYVVKQFHRRRLQRYIVNFALRPTSGLMQLRHETGQGKRRRSSPRPANSPRSPGLANTNLTFVNTPAGADYY